MALCVGFDTSNYTTSVAFCDGGEGRNESRILDVPQGALGLRQSDALFLHVRRLPEIVERLLQGRNLNGAAVVAAGREDLLDRPFLAWHLSGGTTELLHVVPDGAAVHAEVIGGTTDISAGQLIDRTGVLLGLPFPAGRHVDELYYQANSTLSYRVKLQGLQFSLSGMENKVKALMEQGEAPATIARFAVDTVAGAVRRATAAAKERYPGLPVLCSGGVASNSVLRSMLRDACFAAPEFSRDNAMGIAVLARRAYERGVCGEQ